MRQLFRPALTLFVLLSVVTGLVYPWLLARAGGALFPDQAQGSLVRHHGTVVGSLLIGQAFSDPGLFWGRPSATAPAPYNAAASSGSNLGPTNPALIQAIQGRIDTLKAADPSNTLPVPVDLVTASASGLDPHISLAGAYYQVGRVAAARGLTADTVRALVETHKEARQWGFLGEPRVNVLALNLALLDSLPKASAPNVPTPLASTDKAK
ncbi:potassium-transporting ATPase subunit KdpC [Pigmentiphaga litoralis]|uniref:potassium-transporting ATPase subunit KdpC n=1 Tax=Pigmentiphaga litoralis TaxID=516702 RepID=UPI003B43D13D